MSDAPLDNETPQEAQEYYTETVVEYVENKRQRTVLAILLLALFLLLLGITYAVIKLTPGKGAPVSEADTPSGITWVRSIYGWGDGPSEALVAPTDVAIADDGTIWAISGHSTIAGFNPDGTAQRVFEPAGVASLEGIAIGDDGNIYVTDFGGQILSYNTRGEPLQQWMVELPNEVDVRDGKIAVAAAYGIAVFTFDDEVLLQLGGSRGWGEAQFDLPHGIAIAEDGTVFVSDTQNRRVKAYAPDGRLLWISGEAADRTQPGVADVRSEETSIGVLPFVLPSGMTLDGNGRVVLVDPFKFRIVVLDPATGDIVHELRDDGSEGKQALYGDYGQADGFFAYPTGIDYDSTRDWFAVADTYNNRIQILRIPGTGGSALAPIIGGFRTPMVVCCIPWIVLLGFALLAIMRRRREREVASESPA